MGDSNILCMVLSLCVFWNYATERSSDVPYRTIMKIYLLLIHILLKHIVNGITDLLVGFLIPSLVLFVVLKTDKSYF